MFLKLVAGSFDDNGGKASGWAKKLANALVHLGHSVSYTNGGTYEHLQHEVDTLPQAGLVLWFADVPNDKPKLVKEIKERNPKLFLVTSKRNLDNTYSLQDLVSRALVVKANLTIEVTGSRDKVLSTILDPLGGVFLYQEADIAKVASALMSRLEILMRFKRTPSVSVGEAHEAPHSDELDQFLEIVKNQAETFHNLIHGVDTTRMLGNASFRCERGFPSFRHGAEIYVSCRNIDKRYIGANAFVAVRLGEQGVEYFGTVKPSVDSPIQLELYRRYPKVRFMLHSHTYIKDALTTTNPVPCGAIEEADEIWALMPHTNASNFCVNLLGHGSIVLAETLDIFSFVEWIARPSPELLCVK